MKITKTLVLGILSIGAAAFAQAQTQQAENVQPSLNNQPQLIEKVERTPNSVNIPYEKWRLPNGLTVIILEDHSDPIVNVEIAYHVGSDREAPGKSGFAHLFEHMLFQGSEHVKDEEHFKIVSEAGGSLNGNTTSDRTVYFETMPSSHLETALWLESDRMGFLLDSLTTKKFEVQRATVKNEKGQNVENRPYGMVGENLNKALYPLGHPYSWPTIGYTDDLDRVQLEDVKNFFKRWYGPNNAILTISGDVNSADALKKAEKYFGSINKGPDVRKMKADVPILATDQYASYRDNVYFPAVFMAFPTSQLFSKDEPALTILASIMGDGNNSIFYKNFVKNEKAVQASVSNNPEELSGSFLIDIIAYPTDYTGKVNFNEIEENIHKTIDEFEKQGVTEDEVERQKARLETSLISQVGSVQGKAEMLADFEMYSGKPGYNLSDEIARYKAVTKEDVVRVFNKYIKGKHAAIVNVYPKSPMEKDSVKVKSNNPYAGIKPPDDPQYKGLKYIKPVDNFDRNKRPDAGTAKPPAVPEYYSSKLANGLKIIGTQNSEIPMVYLQLEIEGGDMVLDKPDKAGLAALTAAVMDEGSKKYTTEQFSAELDKLGSTINFTGTKQGTIIYVQSLTKNLDATLKLLEEKLFNPRFDEQDFYRARRQMSEGINSSHQDANVMAQSAFTSTLYGENLQGTYARAKSVKKFSLNDVKDYYNKYYSPSSANLVVVGDVSEQDIMQKLAFLNNWQAKQVTTTPVTVNGMPEKTQIYMVNKTDAPQSVILIGHPSIPYDATGDYFKANVMNYTLGGAFNSRINLNLREEKGWTYGARAGFNGTKKFGAYVASASVRRSATDSTVHEFMKEMKDYVDKGIRDEELSFTKSSLLGSDALKYETLSQKAGFLSRIVKYDLPKDYINQQVSIIKGISKNDIDALAKKYIDPNKMIIVIVGDIEREKKPLEKLGLGKVKEIYVD